MMMSLVGESYGVAYAYEAMNILWYNYAFESTWHENGIRTKI